MRARPVHADPCPPGPEPRSGRGRVAYRRAIGPFSTCVQAPRMKPPYILRYLPCIWSSLRPCTVGYTKQGTCPLIASTYSPDAIKGFVSTIKGHLRNRCGFGRTAHARCHTITVPIRAADAERSRVRRSARRRGAARRAVATRARCRARPHLGGRVRRLHLPSISVVALFVALLVIVRVVLDPSVGRGRQRGMKPLAVSPVHY